MYIQNSISRLLPTYAPRDQEPWHVGLGRTVGVGFTRWVGLRENNIIYFRDITFVSSMSNGINDLYFLSLDQFKILTFKRQILYFNFYILWTNLTREVYQHTSYSGLCSPWAPRPGSCSRGWGSPGGRGPRPPTPSSAPGRWGTRGTSGCTCRGWSPPLCSRTWWGTAEWLSTHQSHLLRVRREWNHCKATAGGWWQISCGFPPGFPQGGHSPTTTQTSLKYSNNNKKNKHSKNPTFYILKITFIFLLRSVTFEFNSAEKVKSF